MPELFPSVLIFVLCCLVVAGAKFIYATVGFGAGMFSMSLLALLLPDLSGAVVTLVLLTLVTEVWVLLQAWRHARLWLLMGLIPTTILGLVAGTWLLATGDVVWLKRLLGMVVAGAGVWFLREEYGRRRTAAPEKASTNAANRHERPARTWLSLPIGLASGTLGGLFGTGGPPVIVFLKTRGLDKSAFRSTLIWYFLLMSGLRVAEYLRMDLLGMKEVWAALWLLPATVAGTIVGIVAHDRISERRFARAVSILLLVLGLLLIIGSLA